jgi:chaperonin GroES
MPAIDKLLKFLNTPNIAELLDDDQLHKIADDVILGYNIDQDSREDWLNTNLEAMKIIKHCENPNERRDFPFVDSAKVIYPLLAPATIQLASRLVQHITRNDKVGDCTILGKDEPIVDPQTGQPIPGLYKKKEKASRVSSFLNYEKLIESDTWLKDTHKLCHIVASWGTAFRQVYYDPITKKNCSDLIAPEDVIINHNISCLEKAPRITIRHYLTKNDMVSYQRSGYFLDLNLENLESGTNDGQKNDSRELMPVHEFLCQLCYLDLDEDGYAEPYKVYVHKTSVKTACIVPAYEYADIDVNPEDGEIRYIKPRIDIVDFHCMDDPQGKFYSIGLNYLLLHQNKAITSVVRQLLDSGTLANQQGGFVTKAFKTKERNLQFKMGQFQVLDINPNIDPNKHIIPLPFKEPSQVLLGLLNLLIASGKENGFITDVLVGDAEMQNVPATSMLAMVEQGTRAFKPIVQKLYISLKKEFKLWFHIHAIHADEVTYAKFQDTNLAVFKEDFDEESLDIVPVADPTQSSEAHKYAMIQAKYQLLQNAPSSLNIEALILSIMTDLQLPDPQSFLIPKQSQQPDPKMLKVQLDSKALDHQIQMDELNAQLKAEKEITNKLKLQLKERELDRKETESQGKLLKTASDVKSSQIDSSVKQSLAQIEAFRATTDRIKVHKDNNSGNNNV